MLLLAGLGISLVCMSVGPLWLHTVGKVILLVTSLVAVVGSIVWNRGTRIDILEAKAGSNHRVKRTG